MNIIELTDILKTVNRTNQLFATNHDEYYELKTVGDILDQIKDAKKDRTVSIQIKNKSFNIVFLLTFGELSVLRTVGECADQNAYLIPAGKSVDFNKLLASQD